MAPRRVRVGTVAQSSRHDLCHGVERRWLAQRHVELPGVLVRNQTEDPTGMEQAYCLAGGTFGGSCRHVVVSPSVGSTGRMDALAALSPSLLADSQVNQGGSDCCL